MNILKKFKIYMYDKWSPTTKLFFYLALIAILISIGAWSLNKTGDKITNYNTFIQNEIEGKEQSNLVSEEKIKEFFLRFQLSLSERRNSISKEALKTLPYYLQRPYDMIITISTTHGLGFVFVTPTDNPQIDITPLGPDRDNYLNIYKKNLKNDRFMVLNISFWQQKCGSKRLMENILGLKRPFFTPKRVV